MVITGGILTLICPTEYYKRHAETPKYKNGIKNCFSAQNKAGPTSSHQEQRSMLQHYDHLLPSCALLSFTHALYPINRSASASILSSPPVSFQSKHFKYSFLSQVLAQSLSSVESLEPGWLSSDVRKGNYLLPPETSNKNTSVCN